MCGGKEARLRKATCKNELKSLQIGGAHFRDLNVASHTPPLESLGAALGGHDGIVLSPEMAAMTPVFG